MSDLKKKTKAQLIETIKALQGQLDKYMVLCDYCNGDGRCQECCGSGCCDNCDGDGLVNRYE
jgi:hypothetical protein